MAELQILIDNLITATGIIWEKLLTAHTKKRRESLVTQVPAGSKTLSEQAISNYQKTVLQTKWIVQM